MQVKIKQRERSTIRLKQIPYSTAVRATQAQAEAGTDNQRYMTSLTTKQQVDARIVDQPTAEAGADNVELMTSLRSAQAAAAYLVPTRTVALTENMPAVILAVRTSGYAAAGDGGGALYKRAASEPSHAGKFQSADGAWWELAEDRPNIAQFGCSPSLSDNGPLLDGALVYASGKSLFVPPGTYNVNSIVTGQDGVRICGVRGLSKFYSSSLPTGGTNVGMCMFNFDGKTGFSFDGISLDTGDITVFTGAHRIINALTCSNYSVRDCDARTPGALVASIGSSNYDVQGNRITIASTTGEAIHDGIIDNWAGSHDFLIHNNWIEGSSIGKYGILVTGDNTANEAAACYNFRVVGNQVKNVRWVGVWVNGRHGVNYAFSVNDNNIDGVTEFRGIGVSDSYDFQVTNNRIKSVEFQGILLYQETTGGGTYGCSDFVVSGNIVRDANLGLSANLASGAGIALTENSRKGVVSNNRVIGTLHTSPVYAGSSTADLDIVTPNVDPGTLAAAVRNDSANNNVTYSAKSGTYTPTATGLANVAAVTAEPLRYRRTNNMVRVTGRISVTPTAAASTATQISITLPIASNFTSGSADASGVATSSFGIIGGVRPDTTNDYVILQFPSTNTGSNAIFVDFEYEIK